FTLAIDAGVDFWGAAVGVVVGASVVVVLVLVLVSGTGTDDPVVVAGAASVLVEPPFAPAEEQADSASAKASAAAPLPLPWPADRISFLIAAFDCSGSQMVPHFFHRSRTNAQVGNPIGRYRLCLWEAQFE
ncbi:MAG: hypothetical protein M3326_03030, partial [Actinomycetota bacterium]|nr:hypothetical protein [Actinomycetota bacterium]